MGNDIYKTKIYVYGILNDKDEIIYVGKTSIPKRRLSQHKQYNGWDKMVILDTFYDLEMYWIEKLRHKCKLENKFNKPDVEEWEIGDRVGLQHPNNIAVLDTETNKEYETIQEASRDLNMSRYYIQTKERFVLL